MATYRALFPHRKYSFSHAASDEPVLLNGMRVIFDEKVVLYPVGLEPDSSRAKPEEPNGPEQHGK